MLDPKATPLLAFREHRSRGIEETLFVLMILGDDRTVRATDIAGELEQPVSRLTLEASGSMVRP